jgi:hypothetical protein
MATVGPETDYAVYLASFSLSEGAQSALRGNGDPQSGVRITAPLSAFDQRRATSRPLDAVRRPILPGPLHDPARAQGTLFRIKYDDADVREALARLRDPLAAVGVVSDKVAEPEGIYELVRILVSEVLHLYKYQERREENEARLLANMPISSPLIHSDSNNPGHLYIRSPDLLFTGSGTRIVVPSTCKDASAALLNVKYRLARHRLLGATTVDLGE